MADFLIVGAGIVGLSIARALRGKYPQKKIRIIEKESSLGEHSSGRNSGVLHAGFYYPADTFKAKFSAEGNAYLKDYCKKNNLPLNACGKIVIAKNDFDLGQFQLLLSRAKNNGVELYEVDALEAQKLEPRIKTHKKALWSPATATVSPLSVLKQQAIDLNKSGVEIDLGVKYVKFKSGTIYTSKDSYKNTFLINAAGLYADKIAHDYNIGLNYRILPFKGVYLYYNGTSRNVEPLRRHVYPVPNLNNPFLGVHHTLTVGGGSKIGPTAIPALWREQYSGFSNFRINEFLQIIQDEVSLFADANFNFRELAIEEIRKYFKTKLIQEASGMVSDVYSENYQKWGRAGIRAQLFNPSEKKLVMDFIVERGENSLHVLNAISPAFTCSSPFASWIVSQYL